MEPFRAPRTGREIVAVFWILEGRQVAYEFVLRNDQIRTISSPGRGRAHSGRFRGAQTRRRQKHQIRRRSPNTNGRSTTTTGRRRRRQRHRRVDADDERLRASVEEVKKKIPQATPGRQERQRAKVLTQDHREDVVITRENEFRISKPSPGRQERQAKVITRQPVKQAFSLGTCDKNVKARDS